MAEALASILNRAAAGDAAAAALLVRDYESELRRFIRFRLTDPALRRFLDSMDVCQSVMAAFFVNLRMGRLELTNSGQLIQMLRVMAQNKVRDKLRRARSRRRHSGLETNRVVDVAEVPAAETSPLDDLAGKDLVSAVRNRLSENERQVLDPWMNGADWPTIAAEVGGQPDALRKRMTRGILRAAMELGLIEETL